MFYVVEAILLTKDIKTKTNKGLVSSFSLHFIKTGFFSEDKGRNLNKALDKRLMGDYEFVNMSKKETEDLLKIGKDFINDFDQSVAVFDQSELYPIVFDGLKIENFLSQ